MHPIICTLGPLNVYSYGLMLVVAFLVCSALAMQEAKRQQINPELIFNFCFTVLIFGVIGARIFYVIENAAYYFNRPREIIMLQQGGLSWFGGLISGVISAGVYLKRKKIAFYPFIDLIIPFVALAQALGRIGCWLNGCCFGEDSIPIQIYSSLALVIIFIILRLLQSKPHPAGRILLAYLILYSVKRFFVEFWRADNPVIYSGVTLFQILSLATFCLALAMLVYSKKKRN